MSTLFYFYTFYPAFLVFLCTICDIFRNVLFLSLILPLSFKYLTEAALPEEHCEIVTGWKKCRPGKYILERHLKKGSVFISADSAEVYMVLGLYSTWEEVLGGRPLPVLLDAVLLPFRDRIITDGLVVSRNITFGRGAAADFKDAYMDAKKNGKICFSL